MAVSVEAVSHSFGTLEVLERVSLELRPGEVVAMVGRSGSGKSTLLELIAGLTEQDAGTIRIGAHSSAAERLDSAALMPQSDLLLPWRRALSNATLGLRLSGVGREEARERAGAMLDRLGLGGFERAFPGELSGGMRQRVAFARTLLTGRPLLLLDEPLAALDAITRADLQELLAESLREQGRTALLVTHDVEEALYVADRVLLLGPRPGTIVWETESPVNRAAPRREAISDPSFVAVRERALEALALERHR